ncbi:MAG: hypothetical protein WB586_28630 [Chthoniobacterales bacterium]
MSEEHKVGDLLLIDGEPYIVAEVIEGRLDGHKFLIPVATGPNQAGAVPLDAWWL